MRVERRGYAKGTYLEHTRPWGLYVSGAALCADGKVRKLRRIADTADTYSTVPAAVRVKGKTVTGFVTVETASKSAVETPEDPAYVRFYANKYGKNHALLAEEADK